MNRPFSSAVFYISLLLALTLYFYPLRGDAGFWRPQLVLLLVTYWLLTEPHVLGVGFAWLMGLVLDVLAGGVLGQHALALAICAWILQLAGQRIQHFSVWHQAVLVALLAVFHQLVMVVVELVAGRGAERWAMFYPVLPTVVLWPPVALVLNRLYRSDHVQ